MHCSGLDELMFWLEAEAQERDVLKILCVMLLSLPLMAGSTNKKVYDYELQDIDGHPAPLAAYRGKVLVLVNVASQCGYTPQYSALETLYEKYKDRGLVIVGIPANNFGAQEPGSNEEIKHFCVRKYHVTFPMMSKVSVKGEDKAPLYQFLTDSSVNAQTGGEIRWNFTKFLFDKNGRPVARFEPAVAPDSPEVLAAIEKALESKR